MLIAVLVCSAVGCCLGISSLVMIHLLNTKLTNINKEIEGKFSRRFAQTAECHRAIMDKTKECRDRVIAAIPPVQDIVNSSALDLKEHVSGELNERVRALEETNKKVAEHMSLYKSVMESQERLIEGVEHYAFSAGKKRRHD